jgi:hypothetical protein
VLCLVGRSACHAYSTASRIRRLGITDQSGQIAPARVGVELKRCWPATLQPSICHTGRNGWHWFSRFACQVGRQFSGRQFDAQLAGPMRTSRTDARHGPTHSLLSKGFDAVENAKTITDAGDTHLLQSGLVEFKNDVAANVVGLEDRYLICALYFCEPTADMGI